MHAEALGAIIALVRLSAAALAVDTFLSENGPPFRFDRKRISDNAQTALLILHDELNTLEAIATGVVSRRDANSRSRSGIVTFGLTQGAWGFPKVTGKCPSCGNDSLFLAAGGWVTCSVIGCLDPSAASDLLDPSHQPAHFDAPRYEAGEGGAYQDVGE